MITTLFSSVTVLVGRETSEGAIRGNNLSDCGFYQEKKNIATLHYIYQFVQYDNSLWLNLVPFQHWCLLRGTHPLTGKGTAL